MATQKTRFHVLIDEETAQTALVGFSHIDPAKPLAHAPIAGVDVTADQLEEMANGMLAKAKEMRERQRAIAAKALLGRA